MLPVVTTLGMVFSSCSAPTCWWKKSLPGPLGSYAVERCCNRTSRRCKASVLTMAVLYVALNLLIDVLYGVIDPRVRLEA